MKRTLLDKVTITVLIMISDILTMARKVQTPKKAKTLAEKAGSPLTKTPLNKMSKPKMKAGPPRKVADQALKITDVVKVSLLILMINLSQMPTHRMLLRRRLNLMPELSSSGFLRSNPKLLMK